MTTRELIKVLRERMLKWEILYGTDTPDNDAIESSYCYGYASALSEVRTYLNAIEEQLLPWED